MSDLADIMSTYQGSDGARTTKFFAELAARGPAGAVAVELFRACKASERAKVYRGGVRGRGSFRRMAYERKGWAIDNVATVLTEHAESLAITWGWKTDPLEPVYAEVLYVDLPTGQVSFHTAPRGKGPDYEGEWDQIIGAAPQRICTFCAKVLA